MQGSGNLSLMHSDIVPNGIATKKTTAVTAVASISTTAHTSAVPHPVSLIKNAYTVSPPASKIKPMAEATLATGKVIYIVLLIFLYPTDWIFHSASLVGDGCPFIVTDSDLIYHLWLSEILIIVTF